MSPARGTFTPDPSWPPIIDLARRLWHCEPNQKLSKSDDIRFGAKGSKSVRPSDNTWYDHEAGEGGGYVELHEAAIGPLPARPNGHATGANGTGPKPWDDIATTYDYADADGTLILQVVRTLSGSPRFHQRRRDDTGKWRWSVKDIPGHDNLLYRLPGLRASGDATVWITEGEKDADRLHDEGLIATTNIGGAGKWRAENAQEFRGKRRVVVLPDNDKAGRDHAADVARSLLGVAASVKVLALPGLPEKGDVSDWLDAGGTIEALERLGREAPEAAPEPETEAPEAAPEPELLWRAPTVKETDIPRRIYIVPGYIQRGVVTEIVGPGGHGKSLLFLIWAVALALGIAFGRFRPTQPMHVCSLDVEDDLDEQDRRVAAILRMFDKHHADLGDRLRIMNPMRTGMVLDFDPKTRKLRHTGLMGELQDAIHEFRPDLLMLNPLGELHNAEENDNGTLRHIVSEFRVLAKQEDIGLLLGHHTRKGTPEHGNADAGRGASSIGGVVRKTYTLYEMTAAEGAGWKIPDPQMYFRLDGAKANYDAKNATEWFQRSVVTLDNLDSVVTATPWFPPSEAITDEVVSILMSAVQAGDGGQPWSKRLGKYDRSISRPMAAQGIETRDGQEKLLASLIAKGCHECGFTNAYRKPSFGLRHPAGGPEVDWK